MTNFDPTDHEQVDRLIDEEWRQLDRQLTKTLTSIIKKDRNSPETKQLAKKVLNQIVKGRV